jgi:hypothetical protein
VIAGANASGATASRVNFLDPGAATFTSTNWVDVESGFESIIGAATLGDLVFVFKHTRAYVFYGESIDGTGQPVFNYRALNLGDRIRPYDAAGGIKPGRISSDGNYLYYVASRGVYRTNGGPPELISGPITPAFRNEVAALTGFDNGETYVLATQDRLYVGSRLATTVLVLEKANGQWVIYAFPSVAMAPSTDLRSAYTVNARRLVTLTPTVTTDLGLGLDWFWQSGKYPLAGPGQVAVAPLHSVVGTGTVTMALNSDLYSTQTATVTLGTAPTPAEGWASPLDQEGRWMQTSLSGTGPATISEIKHFVSLVKPAGIG